MPSAKEGSRLAQTHSSPAPETTLEDAFAASALLAGTDTSALSPCLRTFQTGDRVLDTLDGVPAVGLIVSGRVSVSSDTADRRDVRMRTLQCGDCFGISNLFSPEPIQTILQCETTAKIALIEKSALMHLIETDGAFALRYARLTSAKLQFLIRRIELLTTQDHQTRLIAWLLSQPDDAVRFPGTRDVLAAHLGMSRAALFRELAQLDRKGLITTKGTLVRILNREGLQALLNAQQERLDDPLPV